MNQMLHIRMKNQLTWNYCHLFSTWCFCYLLPGFSDYWAFWLWTVERLFV